LNYDARNHEPKKHDMVFVHDDVTYKDVPSVYNSNHIIRGCTHVNLAAQNNCGIINVSGMYCFWWGLNIRVQTARRWRSAAETCGSKHRIV